MTFVELVKSLFRRIFYRDPEEKARRTELRKVYASLSDQMGDWYRARQNLVLPDFASALLDFAHTLKPIADLMRATVAHSDRRIAQRFYDFLIECRLSEAGREIRRALVYDGMIARLGDTIDPGAEFERMDSDFQALLAELESLGAGRIDEEFDGIAAFVDLCRFDFERLLAIFDPAVSIDNPKRKTEFSPVEGERLLPQLLDLHFVLEHFVFEAHLRENIQRLMERRSTEIDPAKRKQLARLFLKIDELLAGVLAPTRLVSLARAIKGDPYFSPEVPLKRGEYFVPYRKRIVAQYDKDRDRVLRERRESSMGTDIVALFGSIDIVSIEGYDEKTDSYLRGEGLTGFLWVKPLCVLRTFVAGLFEPLIREPLKRVLVEGYFDNKTFQNNTANLLYQCEKSSERVSDFEKDLMGAGRLSIMALRHYVEEMKRGKDLAIIVSRLIDSINGIARDIAREEAKLFAALAGAVAEIVADSKMASPSIVNNIRYLGGARNREILGHLSQGRDRLLVLTRVLQGLGVLQASVAIGAEGAGAEDSTPSAGTPAREISPQALSLRVRAPDAPAAGTLATRGGPEPEGQES